MQNKNNKKIVSLVAGIILTITVFVYSFDLIKINDYGTVNNNDDRLSETKTNISLKGGTDLPFDEVIDYSDIWFENDSKKYNHNLAKSSLVLSLASFSSGDIIKNWGEKGDYGREDNIKKVFKELSFINDRYVGYDSSLNNTESKAAFGIAMKKFYVDNIANNVVVVALRSGGYGCEWTDNFNVGDDSSIYHKGFYESAMKVKEYCEKYVSEYCKGENVKFWICGYSRGAAVANILASIIGSPENVYAYTFATPNTVNVKNEDFPDSKNIFNIINPYDPVVTLPPTQWGFDKLGVTMQFPPFDESSPEKKLYDIVSENYYTLTGEKHDLFSHGPVSELMNVIISFIKTRYEYDDKFQDVFCDLATATMTKVKIDGFWKKINFRRYIKNKFGDKADVALEEFAKCTEYQTLKSIGVKVPKSLEQLDIALRLYEYETPEKFLLESMTIDSVSGINSLTDSSAFADFAIGHYPEVYLSWMKAIDENNFVIVNHK